MAQGGQVDVKVKLGSDISGGVQARAELDKLKAKAREVNASNAAVNGLANAMHGVSEAAGVLNKVMTGFGWLAIITSVVGAVKDWHKSLQETKEKAKELRREMEMKAAASQIKEIAAAYKDLTEAIKETADARQRDQEVFDEEVKVRREAEDAELSAAEADALAAVDPNAADADKQKERIRNSFASKKERLAADRKKEDVVLRRQKLQGVADAATSAADQLEATLSADDKAILRARTRAGTLEKLSTMRNDKDGTWYNPKKRTEEGDAEREKQKKDAEKAREEVKKLEADRKAKEKQIADLRAQADQALKISNVIGKSISTAELERETATVKEDTTLAADAASDAKKRAQIDKDRRYLANSDSLVAGVQGKIDAATATKTAAEQKAAKEKEDAWRAQQALDNYNMENKGRSGSSITAKRKELYDAVVKETEEANQAEAELKGVLATFANTVKDLKTQLEQIKREVAAAQKRTTVASGDGAAAE